MSDLPAARLNVLVVCTGNICRSPLAERLLHAQLESAGIPAVVASAGTQSMVGHDMTPEAAQLAQHYGADPTAHRAQQLTERLIADADLVLTATREHRSAVVSLHPRASRYTYTLNQLARLLPGALAPSSEGEPLSPVELVETPQADAATTLRALLGDVSATRGFSPPPTHPDDDDIEDPYRQSAEVYARVGSVVNIAVTTITNDFATAVGRR
ncbi:low molecular weight phosphatase family protein [Cryobacterium sp. PAMC25264]|uniref:arsenate reductase/protein-tyrosine-phosphatase family protein n=1 Tax=Cryobacterium sp. PAMC25264 TaxID=2861288 RepID=UPI001C63063F|nr:low molecular weight phosphatase family protein [Cryobacterium sp. PAMC25264]QYF73729.1 low molecular weight phosphatase family protein [Cryobacterium sp. PAMC25264]